MQPEHASRTGGLTQVIRSPEYVGGDSLDELALEGHAAQEGDIGRQIGVAMETPKRRGSTGRTVAALALAAFLLGFSATAAHATLVQSSQRYLGSYSGKTFYSYSTASDTSPNGAGTTYTPSGSASTGWLGAQGRLYLSNGALCKSSSMIVSNYAAGGWTVYASGHCGIDVYYGMGSAKYWTGSGYSATTTNYSTPHIALP